MLFLVTVSTFLPCERLSLKKSFIDRITILTRLAVTVKHIHRQTRQCFKNENSFQIL